MFKFDRWITYGIWYLERGELPLYPGVYAIYLNERLAYIGQSNDLNTRMRTHRINIRNKTIKTRWGNVLDIYIKIKCPSRYGKEAMIEKKLIDRIRPPFNKSFPRRYNRLKSRL